MTELRSLLIGSAIAALATTGAVAQTSNQGSPRVTEVSQPNRVYQVPATPQGPAPQAAQIAQQSAPATMPPGTPPNAPATAPAAQGVQMPAPAPAGVPPRQTLTAPTPPDPLVQKRDADARANAEYHDAKKASKAQYKEQLKNAKINRAADRQAAANQLKIDSQSGNGTQVPDDETKH
jgi:hypothetical protein